MRTLGDVFKRPYKIKIVPDAAPNAEGQWEFRDINERYLRPKTDWGYLNSLVPAGFHVVAISAGGLDHDAQPIVTEGRK